MVNELLIILDSVPYHIFQESKHPCMDTLGPLQKAYSFAPYTIPSVTAMLYGSLPQPNTPYFPYKEYQDHQHKYLPGEFNKRGYTTYYFHNNPILYPPRFDYYLEAPLHQLLTYFIKHQDPPYFAIFLITETHTPYHIKGDQHASITYVDEQLQGFFPYIDAHVIITSDHGDILTPEPPKRPTHNPREYHRVHYMPQYLHDLLCVPLIEGIT